MSAQALAGLVPAGAVADGSETAAWAWLGDRPDAVVRPESTEEVVRLLAWASAEGVGVVPVGSGRHVGPACVSSPFVVLSTERLAGLERYEPADLTFTARAGTTLDELAGALGAHGQWLPADPPGSPERTLGGLVAEGASGPLGAGYGDVRNHVLGMTVVRGDGRVLRLGGGVVKNVAGFDLLKPVIGSRGRLGVVTSVCMRTFPLPAEDLVIVARADRPEQLADAARAVRTAPLVPASAVLVAPAPALEAGAALLVRLHGARSTVEADRRTLQGRMGRTLDVVPEERRAEVVGLARDAGWDATVVVEVSALSSRLEEVLAACHARAGHSGGGVQLHAEVLGGRVRLGLEAPAAAGSSAAASAAGAPVSSAAAVPAELADRVRALRAAVEGIGGALRILRAPDASAAEGLSSVPSPEERALAEGLERVFDPAGVLWRRRRS